MLLVERKNLCMKFEIFFGQKHSFEALWKWQQEKYSQLVQGSAKSRIYAEKSTKRGFSLMSNDENKFQPSFQIIHIKSAWFLLGLAMALVTTIGVRFLQVWNVSRKEWGREGCLSQQLFNIWFLWHEVLGHNIFTGIKMARP